MNRANSRCNPAELAQNWRAEGRGAPIYAPKGAFKMAQQSPSIGGIGARIGAIGADELAHTRPWANVVQQVVDNCRTARNRRLHISARTE